MFWVSVIGIAKILLATMRVVDVVLSVIVVYEFLLKGLVCAHNSLVPVEKIVCHFYATLVV